MQRQALSPSLRSQIAPFIVMDVMDEARLAQEAGNPVLHLEVGQPGTGAPRAVLDAAHRALDEDPLGYTVAQGDWALRQRIARYYLERYTAQVDANDVLITQGASGAFILGFLAAFDPGDEVVTTRPGYPCYRNILGALDLKPIDIPVDASTGYQLTVEHLRALPRLPRGIIVASPANPTGSVIERDALKALLAFCAEHSIIPFVDEIYHGLNYGESTPASALEFGTDVFVINSFSKYFSMTGWRLGWMVAPATYRRTLEALAQNLVICAPTLAQRAAIAAFDATSELEGHVARYRKNRDVLLNALQSAGISKRAPADGAFYVYADFSDFTEDARAFCKQMLKDIHVATTPGIDFDPVDGRHMVRFSYCAASEVIEEAAARLTSYLAGLPRRA